MILSTWNLEYALHLQFNGMFSLYETSSAFIVAFCYSKIHFNQPGPFKLVKTIFEIFTRFVRFILSM